MLSVDEIGDMDEVEFEGIVQKRPDKVTVLRG